MSPAVHENEPSGPCICRPWLTIMVDEMSDRGMHHIQDDLVDTWVEDWAAVGLNEIEALLAKHAAFLGFLEANDEAV